MSGSQNLLLGGSPQAVPVDPYFYSVTSLLHGDGTNGGQNNTFLDSSSNNFTITRNGNTTQGSFSPFSQTGWGGYFDGSGDFLNFTKQTTTGSFTCECWFYRGEDQTNYHIVFGGSSASVGVDNNQMIVQNDGAVRLTLNATAIISASGTGSVAKNQWNHIAWVRSGTSCAIFVNGNRVGTGTSNAAVNIDRIGSLGGVGAGYDAIGYISNARITTTAVYDPSLTTCTVPTAPLTAVTGTYLLTLQSNRFVDNSASPLTITVNGNTSIQPFSPFNPITPYSTSSVGGSGYFDGSGDYLTAPNNSATDLGSGDFTVEAWIYTNSTNAYQGIIQKYFGPGAYNGWSFRFDNTGKIQFYCADGSASEFTVTGTSTCNNNAWHHVAAVRSGSTVAIYVDGVRENTGTCSFTISSTSSVYIGQHFNGAFVYTGYIAALRVVKGSAVYSGTTYTVPTSPPTAITNTSLLLNYTNGAIFDNAAVADYETVGNAQISTSVKKYGTGSLAFDGTGDYLVAPSNVNLQMGTGDFTVEAWVYVTAAPGSGARARIYSFQNHSASQVGLVLAVINTSGTLYGDAILRSADGTGITIYTGVTAIPLNTWTHLALTRYSSTGRLFVNGILQDTETSQTQNLSQAVQAGVGAATNNTEPFTGYIDDLRISKGIARYPYNFTPPTAEFPNIGGTVTLTADPYYDYTTLLLPGNGTNGAQNNTFLDSSTNAFSITRNGNTTQGTFSPFSQTGWGNYFDGSGDYLSFADNAAFNMGTGNFTAEFWLYTADQTNNYPGIISASVYSDTGAISVRYDNTGHAKKIFIYLAGASPSDPLVTSSAYEFGQWIHVAIVRDSTTALKIYVNGTLDGTGTITSGQVVDFSGANSFYIGRGFDVDGAAGYLAGYVSNVRLVKGTAVYTSNFTPSTTPLTAITNTSLLTCQSNRFIDNSTNNFAITRNGDVSVQAFSPFNPTAAWSAATYGGSGYFDGSGDYLTAPDNVALDLSGDFTVETWVYLPNVSGEKCVFHNHTSDNNGIALNVNSAAPRLLSGSGSWNVILDSSIAISPNCWNHIAGTRSGNTYTIWVNGVSGGTATSSVTPSYSGGAQIGRFTSGVPLAFSGYMANPRVVKGTAVYTTAFTPPTAPLTAIANTSLLLNFTNAGIYDATSKNDLETVGNAQISTTQSKFGGSSMYFDGTGDRLVLPPNPPNNLTTLGTGDFTVEFWVRFSSFYDYISVVSSTRGANGFNCGSQAAAQIVWYANGAERVRGTTTLSANTWYHIAFVRYSGTLKGYVNGVQEGTTYADSINYSTPIIRVGDLDTGGEAFTGYLQDLRITRGIARYLYNFTPPTTAFLTL